ncbi:alkylated DNA repair protein alkB homolog 8 [Caerostris extrusa]|uniref:tRNA (carboxymethyluridine(34)-5-O)-methyltransferase n=1 Tax=Caerostris extrusa TaxID=172846 RepID=A0AAV4V9U2_CAEEX|nr:alkylated DNA repair protein alkB homolog 8 [Caerostris extrusa]
MCKVQSCVIINLKIKSSKYITNSYGGKCIFIGNGGLGCGLNRECLMDIFNQYGHLEKIVMLPAEPYAFVVLNKTEDAIKAFNSVNGQKLKSGHIFYLSYIHNADVPQVTAKDNFLPPGLVLIKDFINEEDEKKFLESITFDDVYDEKTVLKHRKVKHYGYEFKYGINNVDKTECLEEKIPEIFIPHLEKLIVLGYISRVPDQLTVNHYLPGQGIPPHIDTHSAFEDGIISISLGSQTVMDFYGPEKESIPVLLPRRSALIMLGESRYLWKHGITPRKTDIIPCNDSDSDNDKDKLTLCQRSTRVSLTFRLIRDGECHCEFKDQCDSQRKSLSSLNELVTNEKAQELEHKFVNQVYEDIADHFSNTRYKPWPKVVSFLNSVPLGSIVLDIGCGNGKNMKLTSGCFEMGCDASVNLVQVCSKRNVEVFAADCLKLPFRNECIDVAICIAVIHHMSTEIRRKKAIEEIIRILHPGGRALIYVWAFEQNQTKYLKQNSSNDNPCQHVKISDTTSLPIHVNRTNFEQQDILVPWKKISKESHNVHHRFYHVFVKGELESLVQKCGAQIESSYYDDGNWCVILIK